MLVDELSDRIHIFVNNHQKVLEGRKETFGGQLKVLYFRRHMVPATEEWNWTTKGKKEKRRNKEKEGSANLLGVMSLDVLERVFLCFGHCRGCGGCRCRRCRKML